MTDIAQYRVQAVSPALTARPAAGGGHIPTLFVAASNSTAADKAIADYICTGTDDQDTIQEAIDALPSHGQVDVGDKYNFVGGGRLVLAAGTFNVSGTIQTNQLASLIGMGQSTIIRAMPDTPDFSIVRVGPAGGTIDYHINISHLFIDGSDAEYTSIYNRVVGVELNHDWTTVDHVYFYQCSAYGVWVHTGDYHIITDCTFEECAIGRNEGEAERPENVWDDGERTNWRAALGGCPVYSTVSNNKFLNGRMDPIILDGSVFTTIIGNELSDNVFTTSAACITMLNCYGVTVVGNEANSWGRFINIRTLNGGNSYFNTITGNNCSFGGGPGVQGGEVYASVCLIGSGTNDVQRNSVTGNTIVGGISLQGDAVKHNQINGNYVGYRISNLAETESCEILIADGASNNKITNNMIRQYTESMSGFNRTTHAILVEGSTCTDNWVAMNDCRNNYTVAAIGDTGTGTDTDPYNKT